MNFFDFGTFFFFVAAVVIFLQLRNVLGSRTGNEKPPYDPYSSTKKTAAPEPAKQTDNVVSLPTRNMNAAPDEADFKAIDKFAEVGTVLNNGLRAIRTADHNFDPKKFIGGVKIAYEMIITAFAHGDRKTLKNLLSKEVYEGFIAAIEEREKRGEKQIFTFIGVSKADYVSAEIQGNQAEITVNLASDIISATQDQDGKIIDGDAEDIVEVKDIWTFARDIKSNDPNWKLIATEAAS